MNLMGNKLCEKELDGTGFASCPMLGLALAMLAFRF
jgi:hypothetical protein